MGEGSGVRAKAYLTFEYRPKSLSQLVMGKYLTRPLEQICEIPNYNFNILN